jgi:hypothetical protein
MKALMHLNSDQPCLPELTVFDLLERLHPMGSMTCVFILAVLLTTCVNFGIVPILPRYCFFYKIGMTTSYTTVVDIAG